MRQPPFQIPITLLPWAKTLPDTSLAVERTPSKPLKPASTSNEPLPNLIRTPLLSLPSNLKSVIMFFSLYVLLSITETSQLTLISPKLYFWLPASEPASELAPGAFLY